MRYEKQAGVTMLDIRYAMSALPLVDRGISNRSGASKAGTDSYAWRVLLLRSQE